MFDDFVGSVVAHQVPQHVVELAEPLRSSGPPRPLTRDLAGEIVGT